MQVDVPGSVPLLEELPWNDIAMPAGVVGEFTCGKPEWSLHRHPGCYILRHQRSDKFYVGSGNNIYRRVNQHRRGYLDDYNTPGVKEVCLADGGFFFDVAWIATDDKETALDFEQCYLDLYFDTGRMLNRSRNARVATQGMTRTEESKLKQRVSMLGRRHSAATSSKISDANKGSVKTDEHRRKLSEATKGKSIAPVKKRPVLIEGVRYASVNLAGRSLALSPSTVLNRINNTAERFRQWKYSEV